MDTNRNKMSGATAIGDDLLARPTVTVDQAAHVLGVSPWTLYQAIRAGDPPVGVIHVGRRIVVPTASLRRALGLDEEAVP